MKLKHKAKRMYKKYLGTQSTINRDPYYLRFIKQDVDKIVVPLQNMKENLESYCCFPAANMIGRMIKKLNDWKQPNLMRIP